MFISNSRLADTPSLAVTPSLTVIASEVEGSRRISLRVCRGTFRLRGVYPERAKRVEWASLRMTFLRMSLVAFGILLLAAAPEPPKEALAAIDKNALLEHIKVLSADKFEGRAPGSEGERLSVQYITEQFRKLGLKPGNPNGSYTQEVPMAGIFGTPTGAITVGDQRIELHSPNDFVAFTARVTPRVDVSESAHVFIGYCNVAPE